MTVELVAIGPEAQQRLRFPLPPGKKFCLGRAPRAGYKVPWDTKISREHAEVLWNGQFLDIRCLETARNPLVVAGKHNRQLQLAIGDGFQIGETEFQLEKAFADEEPAPTDDILADRGFSSEDLSRVAYGNLDQRLEILANLPKAMASATSDEEFAAQLAALLMRAIPQATATAVIAYSDMASQETSIPDLMRCDTRDDTIRFRPSRRLVQKALSENNSHLHIFKGAQQSAGEFTISANLDWAFCTPVRAEACRGWSLYVSGRSPSGKLLMSEEDLKGDVRFVELLAQFVGAARQIRRLEQQQAGLSQFFSPTVMETLTGDQAQKLLEPRECDITVLFCDVRGFSRRAELCQHSLREMLGRVSHALGVMTRGIVLHEGVIADFQGDSALAFWGWPVPPEEGPAAACRAAISIQNEFRQATSTPNHPLADFRVGIGLSHGRAIAGKIGSTEQAKVGVFGPVVNLGSRLEGLTKLFQASILMDEPTAAFVRANLPASEGRCRRLARIKPFGMETVLTITELLPPAGPDSAITNADIATYESALDAVIEGRWGQAFDLLSELPVRDRAKEFLMILMAEHNYEAPVDWNGTIVMTGK